MPLHFRSLGAVLLAAAAVVAGGCSSDPTTAGSGSSGTAAGGSGTGSGIGGNGNTGGGNTGGNASTGNSAGTFSSGTEGTGGATSAATGCSGAISCESAGLNCGTIGDGCGNTLDCGDSCTDPDETCGGAGTPNVCGKPPCTAKTCTDLGFDCGPAGDGCGKTIDCGDTCPVQGDTCGGGGVSSVCGHGSVCVAKTCGDLGIGCGPAGDGCGKTLDCGTCATGTCGGGGVPSQCGVPVCNPKTCADLGDDCGPVADGCGGILQCGSCSQPKTCGGGGAGNKCGIPSTCTNLCLQQQDCADPTKTTTISGKVYAPNGVDVLPNALVYVPNSAVAKMASGLVGVNTCQSCSADVTGSPLVSTTSKPDGSFTLSNVPVGPNIPIVVQIGRWRRQGVVATVNACVDNPVAASVTRLPRTKAEGDIPLQAFATGAVDALECVMLKIGVDKSEFTNSGGAGRIQIFNGSGKDPDPGYYEFGSGAVVDKNTKNEDVLTATADSLKAYDVVYFPCQGEEFDQPDVAPNKRLSNLVDYTSVGGRVFATHFSYVWLYNKNPFSMTANWDINQPPNFGSDPGTGLINTSFPKGELLAEWLVNVGASTTKGQIPVNTLKHDFDGVVAPSQLWMNVNDPSLGNVPMHYTFNTPVGSPADQQCGRVVYDDFHVENVNAGRFYSYSEYGYTCQELAGDPNYYLNPNDNYCYRTFPNECNVNAAMTAQEKLLEFMIFDLASCVVPDVPVCTPLKCSDLGYNCGLAGDGCGKVIDCGTCPSDQTCGGGGVPSVCGAPECLGETCGDQGIMCGPAGDGCGNQIQCGSCPMGQTCGGGGKSGVCGNQTCAPKTCNDQNIHCGPAGDGCGKALDCGSCPSGQTCGGGGTPGMCGAPACTPKTCMQLGDDCGAVSDGCGKILQCGTCSAPTTCGGGGTANKCGGGGPPA